MLAALKADVEKAEPDDQPAWSRCAQCRRWRRTGWGCDAARLAARAWIKQRRLFPVAEFDKLTARSHIHFSPDGGSAVHAHLHTPPSLGL